MWRSVGSVGSSPDNHPNTTRQLNSYQSFAQLSRLKHNTSNISNQQPHHFMSEYFSKKRAAPVQVHSHHALPRNSNLSISLHPRSKPICRKDQIETTSIEEKQPTPVPKGDLRQSALNLKKQVTEVREEYSLIESFVNRSLGSLRNQINVFSEEVVDRLRRIESREEKESELAKNREEVFSRISRESMLWAEKMRDIDKRKEAIRSTCTHFSTKF